MDAAKNLSHVSDRARVEHELKKAAELRHYWRHIARRGEPVPPEFADVVADEAVPV